MSQLLAYQVGGVFLLCALLMFGTVNGFGGRLRIGTSPLLAIVGALLLFLLYDYRADIETMWPSFNTPEQVAEPVIQQAPAAAVVHTKSHSAKPHQPEPWRGVVTEVEPEPAPVVTAPAVEPPAAPDPTNYLGPHENSPYDSKTKRAVRSVGRFLHIIPKEQKNDRD